MNRLLILAPVALAIAAVLVTDFETPRLESAPNRYLNHQTIGAARAGGITRVSFAVTTPEPAPTGLPEMDPREAQARWEKLERWMDCGKKDSCALPQGDPREAHFFLRDKLLAEGHWFLAHEARTPEQRKRSFAAANRLLAYPEEQVQGLALQWILRLPPETATIERIRENLIDMVDPELAHLAMMELARHRGTPEEDEALDLVENLLFEGSIFASREVARSMALVVTDENRGRVEGWLSELPPRSAKVRLLRESLNGTGL